MGQADTATARYLRRNEIFADMFNFFLYNGEEVSLNLRMRKHLGLCRIIGSI